MTQTELPSIESTDLGEVTGGVAPTNARDKKQVAGLMQSVHSTLEDLARGKLSNDTSITRLAPFIARR